MSQTQAPRREMVPGRLGLIAEAFGPCDVRSRVQPGAVSYMGRLVVRDSGTGEEAVAHPSGALASVDGTVVDGIVASTHAIESNRDSDDPNYLAGDALNVLRKGYIWVQIEADVSVGDPVLVRHTADGGLDKLGAFAPAAGTGLQDISAIAKWEKGGLAADGIALLEINLI